MHCSMAQTANSGYI